MNALVALLVAFASAVAARSAIGALARAVATHRSRYQVDSAGALLATLPLLAPEDVRRLAAASTLVGGAAGAILAGPAGAIASALVGAVLPPLLVRMLRDRRVRRFEAQLVDALETAASGLQAGLSLQQALEGAAAGSASPFREEMGLALREVRMGAALDESLDDLLDRMPSEELALFVDATILARRTGGNIAASYRTIAEALRTRFRSEGKLRALTAQGRMQAWVVGAMPLLLGAVLHRIRPDLVEPLVHHPAGWALGFVVLALEMVGFLWIRRVVTPSF